MCCRTRQMCLLWVLPMRDLLALLRRNPTLYHRAIQQALPKFVFDYLQINPIGVCSTTQRISQCADSLSTSFDMISLCHLNLLLLITLLVACFLQAGLILFLQALYDSIACR